MSSEYHLYLSEQATALSGDQPDIYTFHSFNLVFIEV